MSEEIELLQRIYAGEIAGGEKDWGSHLCPYSAERLERLINLNADDWEGEEDRYRLFLDEYAKLRFLDRHKLKEWCIEHIASTPWKKNIGKRPEWTWNNFLESRASSETPLKYLDIGTCHGLHSIIYFKEKLGAKFEYYSCELLPAYLKLHTIFGIDARPWNCKWTNLEETFGDVKFDVITCTEVIEHLTAEDSEKLLKSMQALLKPGGSLFITYPIDAGLKNVNLKKDPLGHRHQPVLEKVLSHLGSSFEGIESPTFSSGKSDQQAIIAIKKQEEETMKSIAVIGQGFVGGSLTTVFAERGFNVYVYDKAGKIAPGGSNTTPGVANGKAVTSIHDLVWACEHPNTKFSGVYFVCLPTPMYEDGEADLSIVEGALSELAEVPGDRIAVVKSTVPPGTTEKWNKMFEGTGLRVVFNPEFLTEANALDDMRNQNRIVLGGPRPHINTVKLIFQTAFPKVDLVKTSSTTAEMVKYTINCFLATKVSFANELFEICEALDKQGLNIDYDKVVEYSRLDTRLGHSHWAVPGPVPTHDGRYVRGFGGHCFPKDINALITVAKSMGLTPKMLEAAWEKNLDVRGPADRDWEHMQNRAVSKRKL